MIVPPEFCRFCWKRWLNFHSQAYYLTRCPKLRRIPRC